MSDLIVALGLVLVIEGLMLAAAPGAMRRAMEAMEKLPDVPLRIAGLVGALVGLLVVWLIRG
ncbi:MULTISPECIES: DUF2065 domain-containing protein [Ancylobacter]|uniref:DUF2065 domain-containing protein n=1 Tax=Ancylobacter defluvii TaxID=1282440 RepID=A0A9W6JTK5_9HYPH|nr:MULTISPECIES: DUF2065 domain-containing protein [Ancylobacter]MBS7587543.1 DUF2065 domain-containing protein [Ancylobacter defluvii]MDR6952216.1 uncharacterized protein YjeT (DUF2065 family) [Ancylobacter sp. 3268]GLK82233.1 hypothetical protein GCM10017653_03020 [Ancylobacter defluvii]